MIRVVRIELLKLRTMRVTYGLLGIAVGLTTLDAVLRGSRAGVNKRPPLDSATGLTHQLTITGFGLLMAAVLGVILASGEFRHATATYTYLAVPRRGRVLVAKGAAAALAGLVFGAVTTLVTIGIGLAFVAGHGYPVVLGAGTIAHYAIGATVGAALLAVVGVAVGSLLRSQLAAMLTHYLPPAAPQQAAEQAMPIIDEARLEELFGEDTGLASDMLDMFIEHTGPVMEDLARQVQASEPLLGEIQALGHRLAGSCLNLGIQALGQLGRQMEIAARQGELAQVRTLAGECATAFAALRDHIQQRGRGST